LSKHLSLKVSLVLCALTFLVLAGCQPAETTANSNSGSKKVATFEGGEVTEGEVQQFAEQSGLGELDPGSPEYETAVQQVMPQLVGIEIAKTYAEEEGITVSDEEVDKEIEGIERQVGEQARASGQDLSDQEAFDEALKQNQISEDELRQDVRENLPVQQVQERVAGNAEPSYDENKTAQFTQPAQRCVRHILFNKDQQQKAEEVKTQLQDGGDFAALAKENSQDPGSAVKGGDLGCLGKGETVPPFEEAAFAAETGEIVGPVETEFGYHIIEVTEIREEQTQPLDEVETQITDQLAATQQEEEFTKWIEDQKQQRNVKYLPGYEPAA
jgi:peptidyl-prolyl cis-trans isomerase C